MKILFILQYVPYPLDSGGNQAMFNMLDSIRGRHEVSVLFYLKSHAEKEAMGRLQGIWSDVTFYPYEAAHLSPARHLGEAGGDIPDTLSCRFFNYLRQSMERKINRRARKYGRKRPLGQEADFVRTHSCLRLPLPGTQFPDKFLAFVYETARKGFDLVQVEFYECVSLVYLLPQDVKKVFVQHEIHFVRNRNEMALFRETRPDDIFRFNLSMDAELKALSRYDKIIALTETDRQIMNGEDPGLDIYVSPAAVSLPSRPTEFRPAGRDLVFIGGHAHFPNADGVAWFCREVMPLLRARGLDPTLHVVGQWDDDLRSYVSSLSPGTVFTGYVEDLHSFANGKLSVVPIRIGSGMRMKILDSIFSCSPIVTTSKGCEGLPLEAGKDCHVCDTPQAFAAAVEDLMRNRDRQESFARHGLDKIREAFDMKKLLGRRLAFYEEMEARREAGAGAAPLPARYPPGLGPCPGTRLDGNRR